MTIEDDAFVRLFQERAGLSPVDGWAGRDTIAMLDKLAPPKAVATDGMPDDYWPMLAMIESGNRPYVQAQSSSASGLYQFIKSTWEGEGGKWGPTLRPAFGGLRPSEAEQLVRAKSFTAKNAAYLRARGVAINKAALYAAHFLGPVTAAAILAAPLTARADALAGTAATKANPSILQGKTVGDFVDWLERKTGDRAK
ncbi:MAG: hypothetical protein V4523_07795 [Pseudomonadota bacterium]